MSDKSGTGLVLERVCGALSAGDHESARRIARSEYPFEIGNTARRAITERQSMRVFLRDGFTDRYDGTRLVFPGTLRLLSRILPDEFPSHPRWKMASTHIMWWELFPTVDHVVPVARGGSNDESNWVTTSMLRNSAKANWTVAELGWELRPAQVSDWNGLLSWATDFLRAHPEHLADNYVARWHRAAIATMNEARQES